MPSSPAPRMECSSEAKQPPAASERLSRPSPPLTHEDNRRFLQMLREKKESLGVSGEKVEVRFEELTVEAHGRIGRRALPTLPNCAINAAQATGFGEGSNLTTNYIIKILGLSECADTLVGDEMRRGISGGQKKRATIGEMLVGLARCFFMDDISTGLDSSTTYEIIKFIQQMAHLMDITVVISLLQPPPETLELFDDIILLCEGRIVYHGPRENATDFFEIMGFKCPPRKNVADFLQEVTSEMDQKQYWVSDENKYHYHAIEKFAESIRLFYLPRLVQDNVFVPKNKGNNKETSPPLYTETDDLQPWLCWAYWTSPFTYAQNAVALNEFLDERWATEFHYKDATTVGQAILQIRGMLTEWYWYWICVSVLFGFTLVFNVLSIFALQYMNSPHKHEVSTNATKKMTECTNKKVGPEKASTAQFVFPLRPLSLVFDHINYFADMPKEMVKYGVTEKRLQLLQDVSGAFRPGVLTALMGITGAGKTTLLDVLAGRKTGGYTKGTIRIAGYPKKQETFSRISGYCEQSDIHSPNLTVYESLQFSAWLRLPSNVESYQRDMFIDEVMELVELTRLKNAMVGLVGATGLSAEQRKRLTIAVELVASPSILFMDEPTTGLDARAAAIVMRTVRRTMDTGRTVVCTIHQPNIGIFESFDEPVVAMERAVLYREKAAGTYCTLAYTIAQVEVELPYMLVQVFIFAAIVYPMIGFQMIVVKFFWFVLYMVLSFMYYTVLGMMTVALTPNIEIASGLSFLIFIFWNFFSGFLIARELIPVWWRWVYWANPAAWTVYGLMFSQLGDRTELILVPGQPDQTVRGFLEGYLGLEDRYFNLITYLHVVIIAIFAFFLFISLKHLNFQRR
ncbi:hypothetical protein ACQ4PT_039969 [Festuca glaucescens]